MTTSLPAVTDTSTARRLVPTAAPRNTLSPYLWSFKKFADPTPEDTFSLNGKGSWLISDVFVTKSGPGLGYGLWLTDLKLS